MLATFLPWWGFEWVMGNNCFILLQLCLKAYVSGAIVWWFSSLPVFCPAQYLLLNPFSFFYQFTNHMSNFTGIWNSRNCVMCFSCNIWWSLCCLPRYWWSLYISWCSGFVCLDCTSFHNRGTRCRTYLWFEKWVIRRYQIMFEINLITIEIRGCLSFLPVSHHRFVYTIGGTQGYRDVSLAAMDFVWDFQCPWQRWIPKLFWRNSSSGTFNLLYIISVWSYSLWGEPAFCSVQHSACSFCSNSKNAKPGVLQLMPGSGKCLDIIWEINR